jgi:hypothetical protein
MSVIDYDEIPVGTINGSNKDFTVYHTPDAGSLLAYINGLFVSSTVSGTTVTFGMAPYPGDELSVHYTVNAVAATPTATVAPTYSGLDLISDSLTEIDAYGIGQTIEAAVLSLAQRRLNALLDAWKTARRYAYVINDVSYTLTTSKASYTIGRGSGADFTADRPVKLERANLIRVADDPDSRWPLEVIEVALYADIPVPADTAEEPSVIYFQPTFPNATIRPWPTPTVVTNKVELFTWNQLSAISNLSTALSFPPGYYLALMYSLAEDLSGPMSKPISNDLARKARNARALIASLNSKPPRITSDCRQNVGDAL